MYKYLDLFSGAGGMSLGFDKAGFKNVLAIEYDDKIVETYKFNFPNHKLINDDIKNVDRKILEYELDGESVDVIIGGPPCQGFSLAGKYGRNFIDDPRNQLFKEFLRIVEIIKPRIFIIENVARLISHNKKRTINEIMQSIDDIGYHGQYKVLQASEFGIPQKRQRIFIIGSQKNGFSFPKESYVTKTIKQAIDDLPKLESGESSIIPNHVAMKHGKEMLKKMSYISDGGNRNQIPEDLRPKSGDSRKYIRYDSRKPSIPITGDMRKVFHYSQNRALTARELARLQTFPDSFVFLGSSINVQQQIGNAVPPELAYLVANQVHKYLEEEKNNE
ncbi:DNA cytosine methyltransferase [Staphylococcus chromogenes]|uniref:DNA cytosine methyltransferase n=1 Tax=Staphylococcus chromogenes TaxID=46126 RepID=UPI000E67F535|nr:DNA (cytosine-5-)-methyltransferase [Staphylococcus chromogenes]RIM15443.1 DNA (cytosine-5-)-methyltransferase [Staphylococcus chromogenes]